jgi:hypothetical protein
MKNVYFSEKFSPERVRLVSCECALTISIDRLKGGHDPFLYCILDHIMFLLSSVSTESGHVSHE